MDKFGQYLKWENFRKELLITGWWYFSLYEAERLFPNHSASLAKFLSRQAAKGNLVRLKRNLYALPERFPNEYLLANRLYQPSYLSLEFALAYYSLIPESVYTITSVTTKPTRQFVIRETVYGYQTIKKAAFVGYQPQKIDDQTVLIASPDKAVADYLYFVSLGKKQLNERLDWSKTKKEVVAAYLTQNFELADSSVTRVIR